jgi:acetyltransferase-like isoleucine patch superfamily enzyme
MIGAPTRIEDWVWIGANAVVLKGVTIGQRTIVGAGSVVTRDLPPDVIAAGVPARVLRARMPGDQPAALAGAQR